MRGNQEKFKTLLLEIFQFDCADLDFGIYRIMNYKRDVIEKFITQDLPKAIDEELNRGALAEQSQAAEELKEVAEQIRETLGKNALDVDGNLVEVYHETPLGKRYLVLKDKATGGRDRAELEATIFSHLYTFFSRYYQDGDFISKRRYSKRQKYAIPYNGEEVYLYWANHDQYYIKTAEHFRDYTFTSHGVTVHFKLVEADVEQNNVKGNKRFFIPRYDEIIIQHSSLIIPFEYRPLTEQEAITYGKKNQQEKIIEEALEEIPGRLSPKKAAQALAALTAERHKTTDLSAEASAQAGGKSVSFLEHHLRQYTRRNTSDFFIHKDLKGFLTRELDFYLKNEVLNLDEIEATGEERAEGWFQLMRVIKAIGRHIIEFLAQIEDFQKMLWEKRKFITETQYCITVGNINESFYPDIAACEAQWDEWKELLHIDEIEGDMFSGNTRTQEGRIAFLKAHPTLVLDTKHFDRDFTDRLLASFDDLDELIDGLLVHSENWQALNLLREKYRARVKCVHIDPPYNTQTSGFLYKNDYQHSSWLAMMENRITNVTPLLSSDGHFQCHIDENEYERLKSILDYTEIPDVGTVIWDKRNPMLGKKGIATQHEYVCWRSFTNSPIYLRNRNIRLILKKAQEIVHRYGAVTEEARREFAKWIRNYPGLSGGERAYQQLDENGRVYRGVSLEAPEPRTDPKFFKPLIHPKTGMPCPVPRNGWSRTPETLYQLNTRGELLFGPDESVLPQRKVFLTEGSRRQISSIIADPKRGKHDADALGIVFPYSHPVSLYEELIGAAAQGNGNIILDYFAGSGTTGHAVINLNREDGGRRKFILVEMADYFDTVLLPRIKKVTFTPEWKDGKPKRMATQEEAERSPRIVKYIRLESYEDTLNNIEFDEASGQQALKFEDYLLKYMLKWETRKSATLLNVEKLASPFSYKLHIHTNLPAAPGAAQAGGQTREKVVDIPETFNYLLGLHVKTRQVYWNEECGMMNDERSKVKYLVYRGTVDHKEVVIIWRKTRGWTKEDFERDKKFVAEQKLTEGADEVFVNGDSFIRGARALEPVFKARMFSGVEV